MLALDLFKRARQTPQIFGGDAAIIVCAGAAGHTPATAPVKEFDMVTKGTQEATVAGKKDAIVAPSAPMSTTTGGSRSGDDTVSTTLDGTLKKITDNVERTVEQKQINPSGV